MMSNKLFFSCQVLGNHSIYCWPSVFCSDRDLLDHYLVCAHEINNASQLQTQMCSHKMNSYRFKSFGWAGKTVSFGSGECNFPQHQGRVCNQEWQTWCCSRVSAALTPLQDWKAGCRVLHLTDGDSNASVWGWIKAHHWERDVLFLCNLSLCQTYSNIATAQLLSSRDWEEIISPTSAAWLDHMAWRQCWLTSHKGSHTHQYHHCHHQ